MNPAFNQTLPKPTSSPKYQPITAAGQALKTNPLFFVPQTISKMNVTSQSYDLISHQGAKGIAGVIKSFDGQKVQPATGHLSYSACGIAQL